MTHPTLLFPIGKSDFASVRQGYYHYVDKSLLIQQVLQNSAEVLLFPRPRRFGKTLNLSMLRYFFEKPTKALPLEARQSLFMGLAIEKEKEAWAHFAKYPVIFLTFKDVKANTWADAFVAISQLLSGLYEEHNYLLQGNHLSPQATRQFNQILNQEASPAESFSALALLCKYLYDYHGEKVVILIDEYDTCLHEAYAKGYYQEAISFFRNLLSGAFKDNTALFKGVMTGILRVARESLFSGLNNVAVYSLLKPEFATSFGFTEEEVTKLTQTIGHTHLLADIKTWYNGYLFGKKYQIYNPWSILRFLASVDHEFQPYWVNTGSPELIKQLLFTRNLPIRTELETLLQGGRIEKPIYENTVFSDLEKPGQALWSFLLFCGYLTFDSSYQKDDQPYGTLRLVNKEVLSEFRSLTRIWFEEQIGYSLSVEQLIKGLFRGDAQVVEQTLGELMKVSMSFYDVPDSDQKAKTKGKVGNQKKEAPKPKVVQKGDPERVYHMFVLGMMLNLSSEYDLRSNPESGYGRPDLLIIPKVPGKPGVVLEFKVADKGKTVDKAMKDALKQLEERAYETELLQRGATPIYQYAAVFSGKKVSVKLKATTKRPVSSENR